MLGNILKSSKDKKKETKKTTCKKNKKDGMSW